MTDLRYGVRMLAGSPGFTFVALISLNGNRRVDLLFPDSSGGHSKGVHTAVEYLVGNGYFETAGIPIVGGRGFGQADNPRRRGR